jgi:hypothetical protein
MFGESIDGSSVGMQCTYNMFGGKGALGSSLHNHRYPTIKWTSVRELLEAHPAVHCLPPSKGLGRHLLWPLIAVVLVLFVLFLRR